MGLTTPFDVIDIDDPADPRVDDFRDLNSIDRRPDRVGTVDRPGKALVIAEGVIVAQRMLASRFRAHALFGTDRRLEQLRADPATPNGAELAALPYYRTTADVMAQVVGFHLNRGVLAVARRPDPLDPRDLLETARTVAILEGVNDHENIGSIFRNAAGLGVDTVLFGAATADPLYRRAVRVSMGHVLLVPFAHFDQWPSDLNLLHDKGFRVISLTPDPDVPILADAIEGAARVAFMVGAEGPGLSESAMRAGDVRARIPMSGGTDSLNVATAAAVSFYERVRSGA